MIKEFKLGGEWWKGEAEMVRGSSFTGGFDIDKITQIDEFRCIEKIMSNRYDVVL